MDYWKECISIAFDEAGIVATDDQIEEVAGAVEGAHENYGMYSGHDCIPNPQLQEIRQLKSDLEKERSKVVCRDCNGRGRIVHQGPYHSSDSQCDKCRGEGKV